MFAIALLVAAVAPMPAFRVDALQPARRAELRAEAPARVDAFAKRLDSVAAKAERLFADVKGKLPGERTAKRLAMARRLAEWVRERLADGTPEGDGFAELGLADMEEFESSFAGEFACWAESPDNPSVAPAILHLRDFGAAGDGKADDAPAFAKAMDAVRALRGKPAILETGEGVFRLDAVRGVHLPARGLTNLVVRGGGMDRTRIVFGTYDAAGLRLDTCRNVTVRGMELDWAETPFAEGVVTSFDGKTGWVTLKAKDGALAPDDPRFRKGGRRLVCAVFDRDGKMTERPFVFTRGEAERLEEGLFRIRVETGAGVDVALAPGATLSVPDRRPFRTAAAQDSEYCTFEDVRVRCAPSSAFSAVGSRMTAVRRCVIRPKEGFLLSSNADGFYCSRGAYIAHCDFSGMNDDGTNPHGNCAYARKRLDARTVLHTRADAMRPGALCQFVRHDDGQTVALARLESSVPAPEAGEGVWRSTFRDPLPEDLRAGTKGDLMFVPQAYGTGFVAFCNRFANLRNNAMVVQCPNALVESNKVENVLKGLHVACLSFGAWGEGTAPYNVSVRGNSFGNVRIGVSCGALMEGAKPAKCAPISGLAFCGNSIENVAESEWELRNTAHVSIGGPFFRTGKRDGRDVFITPDGRPFYLRGCGTAWNVGDEGLSLLRRCGFNAVAQPTDDVRGRGFAWTFNLNLSTRFASAHPDARCRRDRGHLFPDVDDPRFEPFCRAAVARLCAGTREDPSLLGYFTDNELDFSGQDERRIEKYFSVVTRALREFDPNHLLLGCRFMGSRTADHAVWKACGRHNDAVSVNIYPYVDIYRRSVTVEDRWFGRPGARADIACVLARLGMLCGKPVIVTEWSFPAWDSGLPCETGSGCRVPTQRHRAQATELFIRTVAAVKCVPGYIYFRWRDVEDDRSGENTNYGLVSNDGRTYGELAEAFERVQRGGMDALDEPPPAHREWPALAKTPQEMCAALDREGTAEVFPLANARLDFFAKETSGGKPRYIRLPQKAADGGTRLYEGRACGGTLRLAATARQIAGRNAMMVRMTEIENATGMQLSFGNVWPRLMPIGETMKPRIHVLAYNPWPYDVWLFKDGTFAAIAAPPQSDLESATFHLDRSGAAHADVEMKSLRGATLESGEKRMFGPGAFAFVLWGKGGRAVLDRDLAELQHDWSSMK